jgi:hypothetical protein
VSEVWTEYLEALHTLDRAPGAARARQERIDAEAARATRGGDEYLRSVVARREALERRLREVDELVQRAMAEARVPADGPLLALRLGEPRDTDDALELVDHFEQQVREDIERLAVARRLARRSIARRWYAVAAAVTLAVLVGVLFAIL